MSPTLQVPQTLEVLPKADVGVLLEPEWLQRCRGLWKQEVLQDPQALQKPEVLQKLEVLQELEKLQEPGGVQKPVVH